MLLTCFCDEEAPEIAGAGLADRDDLGKYVTTDIKYTTKNKHLAFRFLKFAHSLHLQEGGQICHKWTNGDTQLVHNFN
jgi:hypothetical protein